MAASSQLQSAAPAAALPARFHRPELDVLRFGAFLLVFLHHALPHETASYSGVPRALAQILAAVGRAGALGVDLFFALSAYLITELLLREHRWTGRLDVRAFYIRRALRIWPLYFFALLILAPLMRFVDPSDVMPASYTAAFVLLAGNWVCAFGGYPASSLALLWSVSIEEQFYLAWPWVLRTNPQRISALAIAMLAIACITRTVLAAGGVVHPGVWCNTLARLDPIAGGALVAFTLRGGRPRWGRGRRMVVIAAGLFGLLAIGGFRGHDGWGSVVTYPAAAASAIAILYGTLGLGLKNAALGYLGKISFGLYVFHVAALRIVPNAIGALALTILAAVVSYRFLETPFLRLKERRFARV
jgi:peptidoglycan/LPS O-acetylase OafA/YrhL